MEGSEPHPAPLQQPSILHTLSLGGGVKVSPPTPSWRKFSCCLCIPAGISRAAAKGGLCPGLLDPLRLPGTWEPTPKSLGGPRPRQAPSCRSFRSPAGFAQPKPILILWPAGRDGGEPSHRRWQPDLPVPSQTSNSKPGQTNQDTELHRFSSLGIAPANPPRLCGCTCPDPEQGLHSHPHQALGQLPLLLQRHKALPDLPLPTRECRKPGASSEGRLCGCRGTHSQATFPPGQAALPRKGTATSSPASR